MEVEKEQELIVEGVVVKLQEQEVRDKMQRNLISGIGFFIMTFGMFFSGFFGGLAMGSNNLNFTGFSIALLSMPIGNLLQIYGREKLKKEKKNAK